MVIMVAKAAEPELVCPVPTFLNVNANPVTPERGSVAVDHYLRIAVIGDTNTGGR